MIVEIYECDNPNCHTRELPEEGGTKRKPNPPYGWIAATVDWFGCGPNVEVIVCKLDCLAPAVAEAQFRAEDR